ncbi:MAG: sugar ABC transporter substrate-binding protein [Desulfobulbaceae bacterium]|nr:MAG: sugar ABC transporter substrate-binding protein [Desulfobulbaceae bacterium]
MVTEDYKIGVEDQVQVNVWGNPDLSVEVPVRPDGKISMPLIGDIQVGGLTPAEVSESIRAKLSTYMRDPNVTVLLTQLRSHEYLSRVRVTGAVNQPSSVPFLQGMTVLDAVLAAGGVNAYASANKTKLHRSTADGVRSYQIRLGDILSGDDIESNVKLRAGDTITVPERAF